MTTDNAPDDAYISAVVTWLAGARQRVTAAAAARIVSRLIDIAMLQVT